MHGHIYCMDKECWCSYVNWDDGTCKIGTCNREKREVKRMYCKYMGLMCSLVNSDDGSCAAAGECPYESEDK